MDLSLDRPAITIGRNQRRTPPINTSGRNLTGRGPWQEMTTGYPARPTHPYYSYCGPPHISANRAVVIAVGGPKRRSSHLTLSSPLIVSFNPVTSAPPPDLGEYFFQTCAEARGPSELQQIHPNIHPAATLINHAREHGLPIFLRRGMTEAELLAVIHYGGTHASSGKEVDFIHHEISK